MAIQDENDLRKLLESLMKGGLMKKKIGPRKIRPRGGVETRPTEKEGKRVPPRMKMPKEMVPEGRKRIKPRTMPLPEGRKRVKQRTMLYRTKP